MQYFLGIDSARDVYAEHGGVFQNIFNVNGKPDCSPYYNSPLLPLPTAHVFANTEVIKQTIFGHEAIFRNQVIELHRLYNKQRELMNELKNDFNRENTQVRMGSSEYDLAKEKQSKVSWLSPCYVPPSVVHTNHVQLEVGESMHTDRAMSQVECASRQCALLHACRCKKYNNKVLDLQLLATENLDDEDTTSSVVAEATYPVRDASPFYTSNEELVDQQPSTLGIHKKGTRPEPASARPILFDLNEPFNFEEATSSTSLEEILSKDFSRNTTQLVSCSSAGDMDKSIHASVAIYNDIDNHDNILHSNCADEPGQKTIDSNLLNQDSNPNSSVISAVSPSLKPKLFSEHLSDHKLKRSSKKRTLKSRKAQGCLASLEKKPKDTLIRVPKSFQLIPVCNKTKTHSKLTSSPMQSVLDFRRTPIVVQALPCTNAPVAVQKKKPHTRNSFLSPSFNLVKTSTKGKKRRSDLRASNVNWDSYRMEPPSPENEDCAPPRGESDENFSEKRLRFYAGDDWETETDVARIGAKALVFLAAADGCINRHSDFEPSLHSPANPLHWFAEVVSNVEFTGESSLLSVDSQMESIFHNLDDFETMTLKLEDTNKEENYYRNVIACQDKKLTLVTSVSGRATRARGKRSKKLKDFQGGILPGISSLSKHEVAEDLHLIEGLMEATGTPNIFSSKKRNGCSRGRRQSNNTNAIIAENSPCVLLDLQNETNSKSQTNERKRMMIDWGKITRRRRGQRYPARKLTFIQVAQALKAH